MNARIGELFAGYGGLGMGVTSVLDAEVAWFSEFDKAPSKILAHHWPDVPNHGDITKIDWSTVEPVDILTGGFPCQDVSLAGARAGMTATSRSGLWSEFARAIEALKPELVVIENVRGLLSASAAGPMESDPWGVGDGSSRSVVNALGAVLGDLAGLGYDAEWCGVRAADAGAPHGRFRVFILAYPAGSGRDGGPRLEVGNALRGTAATGSGQVAADTEHLELTREQGTVGWEPATSGGSDDVAPNASSDEPQRWGIRRNVGGTPNCHEGAREERERVRNAASDRSAIATNTNDAGRSEHSRTVASASQLTPLNSVAAALSDSCGIGGDERYSNAEFGSEGADGASVAHERGPRPGGFEWGEYAPAIERWEAVTRPALAPTKDDGKNGSHRLSAAFVEWMMGLPEGHVTDVGLTRNEQLKALGNGVVPQQVALALRHLLTRTTGAA